MKKPYLPSVSFEQILQYKSEDAQTHTSSRIVNAVIEAMCDNHLLECNEIADYLCVDARKLAAAVQLETGMTFTEVVRQYRIAKVQEYIDSHPDASLEEVAHANGYASNASMWRLFKDRLRQTANGKTSSAGADWTREMHKKHKR